MKTSLLETVDGQMLFNLKIESTVQLWRQRLELLHTGTYGVIPPGLGPLGLPSRAHEDASPVTARRGSSEGALPQGLPRRPQPGAHARRTRTCSLGTYLEPVAQLGCARAPELKKLRVNRCALF